MIIADRLPEDALLHRYAERPECYTDCFSTKVPKEVTLPQFVCAFYTAPLFRCERFILTHTVKRPSTDTEARAFASGQATKFAAWDLEDRSETQLLACDMSAATRSWFMVEQVGSTTVLRFGSAVTPGTGKELGLAVRLAMPLHRLYSKLLLAGAVRQLNRGRY